MSTPRTIKEAVLEPIHTSIYAIFVVSICMVWSRILIELYDSARATAESLEESQLVSLVVSFFRNCLYKLTTNSNFRSSLAIIKYQCRNSLSALWYLVPCLVGAFLAFFSSPLISQARLEVELVLSQPLPSFPIVCLLHSLSVLF